MTKSMKFLFLLSLSYPALLWFIAFSTIRFATLPDFAAYHQFLIAHSILALLGIAVATAGIHQSAITIRIATKSDRSTRRYYATLVIESLLTLWFGLLLVASIVLKDV